MYKHDAAGDVLLFDDVAVLYKRAGDLIIIVTGAQDENELILTAVLSGVSEALTILLRYDLSLSYIHRASAIAEVAPDHWRSCQQQHLWHGRLLRPLSP